MTTEAAIREALTDVVDPCSAATGSGLDVVAMGMVDEVVVDDGHVGVSHLLTTPACLMVPYFIDETRAAVGALPGVATVTVETDDGTTWTPDRRSDEAEVARGRVLAEYEARYAARVDARLADE